MEDNNNNQLDLGVLSAALEVAVLRQLVAHQNKQIKELTRALEAYEKIALAAAPVGGTA